MSKVVRYSVMAVVCILIVLVLFVYVRNITALPEFTTPKNLPASVMTDTVNIKVKALPAKLVRAEIKVDLPPEEHLISSVVLPKSKTPVDVITVINETTGLAEIRSSVHPADPLEFPFTGRVGASGGLSSLHGRVISVEAEVVPVKILGTSVALQVRASGFPDSLPGAGVARQEFYGGIAVFKEF